MNEKESTVSTEENDKYNPTAKLTFNKLPFAEYMERKINETESKTITEDCNITRPETPNAMPRSTFNKRSVSNEYTERTMNRKESKASTEKNPTDPTSNLTFNKSPYATAENKISMTMKKRRHTVSYKLTLLKEADICRNVPGAIGALLRKEGIASSTLCDWRKQRENGQLSALGTPSVVKARDPSSKTHYEQLVREKERLEKRLKQAELIIEVQKKIAEFLESSSFQTEVK